MKWILEKAKSLLFRAANKYFTALKYGLKVAIGGITMGIVMIPIVFVTQLVLSWFGIDLQHDVVNLLPIDKSDTKMLIALTLMIGVVEETLYRYLLMDCLLTKFLELPEVIALIASSLTFGLMHLNNTPYNMWLSAPQAIGAIGGGLVLGLFYRKYGLHYSIMVHALYDFLVFKWLS